MVGRRIWVLLVVLLAACGGGSEPEDETQLRERIALEMSQTEEAGLRLESSILTWLNATGLAQLDTDVWRGRLDELCARRFWTDPAIVRAQADAIVAADEAVAVRAPESGPVDMPAAYQALWIMAVDHCRNLIPPATLEAGPPNFRSG